MGEDRFSVGDHPQTQAEPPPQVILSQGSAETIGQVVGTAIKRTIEEEKNLAAATD